MAKSFVDTITSQTMNLDLTRAAGGARDMPGLATDLFLIVIRMREAEELGDPAALRKLIMYFIDLFKKNCITAGLGKDAVDEAVYAIVALIDETVLSVPGACRDYWFDRPLQLDLFGDNIAGEEFYIKLQKILAQAEKKKDVLEIYYLCLSLGFEGKFKIMNPEERTVLLEETGRKLRRTKIRVSSNLSPHGNRTDYIRPQKKISGFGIPIWVGAVAAAGLTVAVYLTCMLMSSMKLESVLNIVERMKLR
jgi:type VI secretion system protein ImpK